MAIIYFIIGFLFYSSNGKGVNYLSGYNMKSNEKRKNYDEKAMCILYGKRIMFMAIPFLIGAVIDAYREGVGCVAAWGICVIMFIMLVKKRYQIEK